MSNIGLILISTFFLISCASKVESGQVLLKSGVETENDKALVKEVVRKDLPKMTSCYRHELKSKPDLKGKINIEIRIDDTGSVQSAKVTSSELKNANVENCVAHIIMAEKFTPAPTNTVAVIDYPLTFDHQAENEHNGK